MEPGVSTVRLADVAGELIRFVLSSHLAGDPDLAAGLGLSAAYCSHLLLDDTNDTDIGHGGGVPRYPLCEKLASEFVKCIEAGGFPRSAAARATAPGVPAEERCEAREREWERLVLEKGLELSRMYNAVEFELHVQEPYFTQLKAETKKVEGRLAYGNYNQVTQGSLLLFNKCLLLNVERVTKYSSFSEMLQAEAIANLLPGVATIEEGVKIYRKFYTEEQERANGALAISVSKSSSQLYMVMKELLAGLGYEGVGRLLGMATTAGTIPDGLPPPRSELITSSVKPCQPNSLRFVNLVIMYLLRFMMAYFVGGERLFFN